MILSGDSCYAKRSKNSYNNNPKTFLDRIFGRKNQQPGHAYAGAALCASRHHFCVGSQNFCTVQCMQRG
jgi:hypothetical protein